MTADNWIALAGVLVVTFGGLYGVIISNLKGIIKDEINALRQSLRDEKVQELKDEIIMLREHASKTK